MKILLTLFAIAFLFKSQATPVKDSSDIFIVQQLQHKTVMLETEKAVFWFDGIQDMTKAKKFAEEVNDGVKAIEKFTGKRFDAAHYGSAKIEYFISHYTTISHVYHGYHHNVGKSMPYVFFSAKRFERGALPYLHETTHLILHDFTSLWTREGMAEWVAKRVAKQSGKGHLPFYDKEESANAHQLTADILVQNGKEFVDNLVGTNGIPEFKNSEIRRLFYIASTSFVDYISSFITKERLLQLYFADDTRETLETMMGKSMEELKTDWLNAIQKL